MSRMRKRGPSTVHVVYQGDSRVNCGATRSFYVEYFLENASFNPVGRAAASGASPGPIWHMRSAWCPVLSETVLCTPGRGADPLYSAGTPKGVDGHALHSAWEPIGPPSAVPH